MLNNDYREMLQLLSEEGVEFLLVGAYAMAAHGYPRSTMDIDIWVKPSVHNAQAVIRALNRFGAPLHDLTDADLQSVDTIFQIGVPPRRIDIITGASGLQFDETYAQSVEVNVEDLRVRIPSLDHLIVNKTASGRAKDMADVEALKDLKESSE